MVGWVWLLRPVRTVVTFFRALSKRGQVVSDGGWYMQRDTTHVKDCDMKDSCENTNARAGFLHVLQLLTRSGPTPALPGGRGCETAEHQSGPTVHVLRCTSPLAQLLFASLAAKFGFNPQRFNSRKKKFFIKLDNSLIYHGIFFFNDRNLYSSVWLNYVSPRFRK